MRTAALIAVRMGSSRLPRKALLPILGKPMIERLIERVRRSSNIDEIVIATTTLEEDDTLEALAMQMGVGCFRGSADDVLGRITAAAAASGCDRVVELLGDNPLIHVDLIDDVIALFENGAFDYAVNVTYEQPHAPPDAARFPIGVRVEVYRPEVIARSAAEATHPHNREHSTSFIVEHPELFKLGYMEATGRWAPLRRPEATFAVNHRQNFDLINRIFETCYPLDDNFTLFAAMETFDDDPELASLMGAPKAS